MTEPTPKVAIVGMGLSRDDLTARHLRIVRDAEVLVGGQRHLDAFPEITAEKRLIDKDLKSLAVFIEEEMSRRRVVVLASGDPLFFGIGSYLVRCLGPENVEIHPNITTAAAAFARIKAPWQHTPVVSLHGRKKTEEVLKPLMANERIGVYTDPDKDPAWLARYLMDHRMDHLAMWVLEQLGTPHEQVRRFSPETAARKVFQQPNFVILENPAPEAMPKPLSGFGLPDSEFIHEKGLITKPEVRAVTLSKLRLAPNHVFWDLGAGSGSISMEAAMMVPRGKVLAVERKAERTRQITENRQRFGAENLDIIHGEIMAVMDRLPTPHRIFIGGGGRELEKIISSATERLESGGILVANTVLLDTLNAGLAAMENAGMKTEAIQIQVNRSKPMPYSRRFAAENPVWVVSGIKD